MLGYSLQGRLIHLWQLTRGIRSFLVIGGVHGDEVEGYGLIERYLASGKWGSLEIAGTALMCGIEK
ncbi:hypothetical protein [Synechococcus sp. H55.10]|uniref:hypothetical protein n=1 Tax=Synechococcus sp. H55.10 TaxID=2964503 RepID=UPI0039C6D113